MGIKVRTITIPAYDGRICDIFGTKCFIYFSEDKLIAFVPKSDGNFDIYSCHASTKHKDELEFTIKQLTELEWEPIPDSKIKNSVYAGMFYSLLEETIGKE